MYPAGHSAHPCSVLFLPPEHLYSPVSQQKKYEFLYKHQSGYGLSSHTPLTLVTSSCARITAQTHVCDTALENRGLTEGVFPRSRRVDRRPGIANALVSGRRCRGGALHFPPRRHAPLGPTTPAVQKGAIPAASQLLASGAPPPRHHYHHHPVPGVASHASGVPGARAPARLTNAGRRRAIGAARISPYRVVR